jgi:ubiquinone/menaquinone biosynthesis C-methylase UbiE
VGGDAAQSRTDDLRLTYTRAVANTTRTYDVAVWCAPPDLAAAHACAAHLRPHLRVVVMDPSALESAVADRRPWAVTPEARTHLFVVAARGTAAGSEGTSASMVQAGAVDAMVVAPGVATAALRRLAGDAGRVWDLRTAWDDPVAWQALIGHLVARGVAAETAIEARFPLAPAHLQRATRQSYDAIAEQFAERWFDHPPRRELELFLQRLPPGSRVLDAGCGPGHHARIVSLAGHDVVGIDLSEGMLAQARRRTRGIELMTMDLGGLRFPDRTFDAVWCAAAILHVPREQLAAVFRGFRAVVRPGGTVAVNFQVGRPSELVQRGADNRFFEYYQDGGEMTAALEAAGLSVDTAVAGETTRNTHALAITLKWQTLYATRRSVGDVGDGAIPGEDRLT